MAVGEDVAALEVGVFRFVVSLLPPGVLFGAKSSEEKG